MADQVLTDKEVRRRKNHECDYCTEVIPKGERARYRAVVFDRGFRTEHFHLACYEAMDDPNLYDAVQRRNKELADE